MSNLVYQPSSQEKALILQEVTNLDRPELQKANEVILEFSDKYEEVIHRMSEEFGVKAKDAVAIVKAKASNSSMVNVLIEKVGGENEHEILRTAADISIDARMACGTILQSILGFVYGRLCKILNTPEKASLKKLLTDGVFELTEIGQSGASELLEVLLSGSFDKFKSKKAVNYYLQAIVNKALQYVYNSRGFSGGKSLNVYISAYNRAVEKINASSDQKWDSSVIFNLMLEDPRLSKVLKSRLRRNPKIVDEIYWLKEGYKTTDLYSMVGKGNLEYGDKGRALYEQIESDSKTPEQIALEEEETELKLKSIQDVLTDTLTPIEIQVLAARLGLEASGLESSTEVKSTFRLGLGIPSSYEDIVEFLDLETIQEVKNIEKSALKKLRSGAKLSKASLIDFLFKYAARWDEESEKKIRSYYLYEKGRGRDTKIIAEELSKILAKSPYNYVDDQGKPTKSPHSIELKINRMAREDDELKSFQYRRWNGPAEVVEELRKIYLGLKTPNQQNNQLPGEVAMESAQSNPHKFRINRYYLATHHQDVDSQMVMHSKPRCDELGTECWWENYYEPIVQAIHQTQGGNIEDIDFGKDEDAKNQFINYQIRRRANWDKDSILEVLSKVHKAGYPVNAQFFAKFPEIYKQELGINRSLEGFRNKVPEIFGSWGEALISIGAADLEYYNDDKISSVEERVVQAFLDRNEIPYRKCSLSDRIKIDDEEILKLGYKHFVPDFYITKAGNDWIPIEVFGDIQEGKQTTNSLLTAGELYKEKKEAKKTFYAKRYDGFISIESDELNVADLDSILYKKFAEYLDDSKVILTKEGLKRVKAYLDLREYSANDFELLPSNFLGISCESSSSGDLIENTLSLYRDIHTAQSNKVIKTSNSKINLNKQEEKIFNLLKKVIAAKCPNTELRAAGGWVRDKLLGKESKDIDIAVSNMTGLEFAKLVKEYMNEQI